MNVQLACACGAEMTIDESPDDSTNLVIMGRWFEQHPHGEPLTFRPTYMGTGVGTHP